MAEITLHQYCDEAKELIRADAYDQAIAICGHILRHHPKHVLSYRLMGEACLEKGDYVEAANLLKRVLSADPEDVIVYAGLGIIYDEQGALEEAIWQLERAFELTPGNAEIREELQRLYEERDGAAPPKLKLTPAALGRLYLREGLYQRAVDEFRGVLEEDPERTDIQVTLAEALWRSDQRLEAAEVCEEILENFPNCLKVNLILGEILLSSGREEEGRALLRTAQAMDPENIVAQELFRDQSPLPLEPIHVPRLDKAELESELEGISPKAPPPSETVEPEEEAPPLIPEAELEEAMPDWLRRLQEGERQAAEEGQAVPSRAEGMPDWLRELETETSEVPQAYPEPGEKAPMVEEEMPTWLRELGEEAEATDAEETVAAPAEEEAAPQREPGLEDIESEGPVAPSWQEQLSTVEVEEMEVSEETLARLQETMPEESASIEEIMAWVERSRELMAEDEQPEGSAEEGPAPAEEVPDWLGELRAEAGEREIVSPPEEMEELPSWVPRLKAEADESAPSQEEAVAEPEGMVGGAGELTKHPAEEEPEFTEPVSEELRPSLKGKEVESPTIGALEKEPAIAEEEAEISKETLARLHETMPDESASIEEIMAWMERSKALMAEEIGSEQAAEEEVEEVAPSPEAEDVPTWLRELSPEAAEEEMEAAFGEGEGPAKEEALPTPEEEIPTWLRSLKPEALEEETPLEEAEAPVGEAPVATPEEEIPAWLRKLKPEVVEEEEGVAVEEVGTPVGEGRVPSEEEVPAWLHELRAEAAREEAEAPSEEPLPVEGKAPPIPEEERPSWLRELSAEVPEQEVKAPLAEDEALVEKVAGPVEEVEEEQVPAWLQELRTEATREGFEKPAEEGAPTLPVPEEKPPSELRPEAAEEEVVAAHVEPGAPLAQAATPPEEEMPSWLRELRAKGAEEETKGPEAVEEEVAAALAETEAPVPEEAAPLEEGEIPSWLRELRSEAASGEVTAATEELEAFEEEEAAKEEELPTWLLELRAEAARERTEVREKRVAAEEAPSVPEEEREPFVVEEAVPPTTEKVEEKADQAVWAVEDYLEHLAADPKDHNARLALARVYSRLGDLDQAVSQYSEIVSFGSSLFNEVIEDLEATADDMPDHLPTHELLADAYMKAGRLQKALEKYRWLRGMLGS